MFLGQYAHSVDSKSRLTVPVRFRAALASGATIVQGFERNLNVYTTEAFQKLAKAASSHTMTNPEVRAMRRLVFGRAHEASLDSAGRLLIPTFLKSYAGLDGAATIVGAGDYFEIWNPDDWQIELEAVTDPDTNSERFAPFDLSTE
jgi:MraZ protein